MPQAVISFGSNIEPEKNIEEAIRLLSEDVIILMTSPVYETPPVGAEDAPRFLNGVVVAETDLDPEELVDHVLKPIEDRLGRERSEDRNAPRTIDLDLVQHEFGPTNRACLDDVFVAVPLADVAPDRIHPQSGKSFSERAREMAVQRAGFKARPEMDRRLSSILAAG